MRIGKKKELERAGVRLPGRVVERDLKKEIIPWMDRDEIIVITGARQTGKSVLLYQLIYDLLLPKTENIYYFNLDAPHQLDLFTTQDHLIDLITRSKDRVYVIIDEIQRLKEPGLFLKGIYDLHLPVKMIVSGSSSVEIKSKVQEALTGRKIVFHLNPFNLKELALAIQPGKDFKEVLYHYLTYGGYPAVAMVSNRKKKLHILKEIFQSYIERDIKSFLKVENEASFRNLVRILASQVGNLVNKDELSSTLGIHKNTLDNYLFYLEQTFMIDFVRPFYKNPRKELLKSPKLYFCDLGMRNFAIGSFGDFEFRPDKGNLFENFSYLCLKEKLDPLTPIHFWRTKAGAEVDFVVLSGLNPIPIEVKATALKEFKVGKSLRSFIQTYKPLSAYCINLSLKGKYLPNGTPINFLTPLDLMKIKKL